MIFHSKLLVYQRVNPIPFSSHSPRKISPSRDWRVAAAGVFSVFVRWFRYVEYQVATWPCANESNIEIREIYPGWWYAYNSEKYESQMGVWFPRYGKLKFVFQTTDQQWLDFIISWYPSWDITRSSVDTHVLHRHTPGKRLDCFAIFSIHVSDFKSKLRSTRPPRSTMPTNADSNWRLILPARPGSGRCFNCINCTCWKRKDGFANEELRSISQPPEPK